jgi:hypothetical protein
MLSLAHCWNARQKRSREEGPAVALMSSKGKNSGQYWQHWKKYFFDIACRKMPL